MDAKQFKSLIKTSSFLILFSQLLLGCGGGGSSITSVPSQGQPPPINPAAPSITLTLPESAKLGQLIPISVSVNTPGELALIEAQTSGPSGNIFATFSPQELGCPPAALACSFSQDFTLGFSAIPGTYTYTLKVTDQVGQTTTEQGTILITL